MTNAELRDVYWLLNSFENKEINMTECLGGIEKIVDRNNKEICDTCNGQHNNIIPCPKCGMLKDTIDE